MKLWFMNGIYGISFDNQTEAEKVMQFLEKGIEKASKVDVEQTETVIKFNEKGKTDVGKS